MYNDQKCDLHFTHTTFNYKVSKSLETITLWSGINLSNRLKKLSDVTTLHSTNTSVTARDHQTWLAQTQTLVQNGLTKSLPGTSLYLYAQEWKRNFDPLLSVRLTALAMSGEVGMCFDQPSQNKVLENTSVDQELVHIFVDYSNITAGLELPGGNHPINPAGLASFLENNRTCAEKQIAGSFPHAGHDVWRVWNQLGYRTRIASTSGKGDLT
jgi:hypothetical protein